MTRLLFRLDLEVLWNNLQHYRRENPKRFRLLFLVAYIVFALWYYLFRHMAARPEAFLSHWPAVRYVSPVVVASLVAGFGAYNRVTGWLARWASGSWSVLPVEPRGIANWLITATLVLDLPWILLALAVSIGTSWLLKLVWWQEFPFLLLGTLILIVMASVAKTLAALIMRLGSGPFLNAPNWVLRLLGRLLAMLLVQPLAAFWWLAEFTRKTNPLLTAISLAVLIGGTAALFWLARRLFLGNWHALAASYERQQTHRKTGEKLRLANLIARAYRSPLTRFVTLYNLRTDMQMQRWGQPVSTAGRRLYFNLLMLPLVCLLILVGFMASRQEGNPLYVSAFGAFWATMLATASLPEPMPVMRMLRILPVSLGQWLWAATAFPLVYAGLLLIGTAVLAAIVDPVEILRSWGVLFGIFIALVPLRLALITALPDAKQTREFVFIGIAGAAAAFYYYTRLWVPLVPAMLGVQIYMFYRAAREWRRREEGLCG